MKSIVNNLKIFALIFSAIVIILLPASVNASITNGAIDSTFKYAWGENIGWVNFGEVKGNVIITDSGITGYAWSANYGWINLSPSTYGILNDGSGNLSGHAWGENLGWIDFSAVTINTSGEFIGYAIIENNSSQISLNCVNTSSCSSSDFKVKTEWRPRSVRPKCNNALDDDGDGKIDFPADSGCNSLIDTDETDAANGSVIIIPQSANRSVVQEIVPPVNETSPQINEPNANLNEPSAPAQTDSQPISQPSQPSSGGSVIGGLSQPSQPSGSNSVITGPSLLGPNVNQPILSPAPSEPIPSQLTPSKPPPLKPLAPAYKAKSFQTRVNNIISKVFNMAKAEINVVKNFSIKIISFMKNFIKSLFFWR